MAVGNYTAQFSPEWTVIIDIINVFIHRHLTGITTRHRGGQWTVDSGQWTVDSGQWTVDTVHTGPACLLAASCHNQQHYIMISSETEAHIHIHTCNLQDCFLNITGFQGQFPAFFWPLGLAEWLGLGQPIELLLWSLRLWADWRTQLMSNIDGVVIKIAGRRKLLMRIFGILV